MKVPVERREEFKRIKKRDVRIQGFSDCTAIYVPLIEGRDVVLPIFGVHGTLMACASMFTFFLATGNAMRAGIDAGLGVEWQPKELTGPVLQSAYDIEQSAEEPRIVIGDGLWEYLTIEENLIGDNLRVVLGREAARKCKSFIIEDHDGKRVLDYLGVNFKDELGDFWKKIPAIDAFEFVESEIARFQKEKDEKLSSRYQRVHSYMKKMIPLWDGSDRLPKSR